MARFGKTIVTKSNMTPEQHKAFKKKAAEQHPKMCEEINGRVAKIRKLVQGFNPLILLQCGYFHFACSTIGKTSESEYGFEEMVTARMLDYIQSVIVSTPCSNVNITKFDETAWKELFSEVKSLYDTLIPWFQIYRSAFLEATQKDYDVNYDYFYVQAEMLWLSVRCDRYFVHDMPHLYNLLSPHDEIFNELFGISGNNFLKEIEKIQNSLSQGLGIVVNEMKEFQDKVMAEVEKKEDKILESDLPNLAKETIKEKGWGDWSQSIIGRFFGLDLFDLQKITNLPTALLRELSWEPGEDKTFFAAGDYSGWPLRLMPVMVRPFLRVGDKFYCFDLANLMDHIYRMAQRLITRLKPEYGKTWNERQKAVSEDIPFRLFERIFPGATIYKNVYYRAPIGPGDKTDWCELDGIVVYDDHLIVTEIKAGAFAYTPPTSDFNAYITSVKDLIQKPAQQASRFVQLLDSKGEVNICNIEHKHIGTVRKDDFREITPCSITVDNLTELAARADKLKRIGVVVPQGMWCISVNDLRVYADLFDSPVIFAHFLEQRKKAAFEKEVELLDELDHLGLYFKHNFYVQYIEGLVTDFGANHANWCGYKQKLDQYYHMLIVDSENAQKPKQDKLNGYFSRTIELIDTSKKPGRCKAASYILDLNGELRDAFNSMIEEVLVKQDKSRRIMPVTLLSDRALTVFCCSKGISLPTRKWMQEHALKRMLIAGEKLWLSLILTFDADHSLSKVEFEHLGEKDIPVDERARMEKAAKEMQRQEVDRIVSEKGEIGRNEICPCGSGKKYKRCCGLGN